MERRQMVVSVVASLAVLALAGVLLADLVSQIRFREKTLTDLQFKLEVIDRLWRDGADAGQDRVKDAVIAAERAAAIDLLLSRERDRPRHRPSQEEMSALAAFENAGHEDVYKAFLALKYPEWEPPPSTQVAP